ncbi:MAG: thioredoxin domain-containing protein [Gammaproteobacteria bacterium]
MRDTSHNNDLAGETSPYLLQHAHNPVDWHPWNDEALALARTQNKPILLSIGYSACHWCHVMAHESFEDPDTAALMNQAFVNIKVDREERPDLDRVYQLAHQILAQRGGGWPLTVFLMPDDLTPFFAGTYFPLEARYGMPSFKEVLTRVSAFFHEQQPQLRQQNASLQQLFRRIEAENTRPAETLDSAPIEAAQRALAESFDPRFGGFGRAPKFPHAPALEFLLRRAAVAADSGVHARHMLTTSLTRMAEGGIYDQLGGGFSRYSVDAEWNIPHFEKMLYDNGPLLALYAQSFKHTSDTLYKRVAEGIAGWVLREMQSPQGGYYSSLDADSEGHEGKYYVWDKEEVQRMLSADEYAIFAPHYGLDRPPNFEGRWHLHVQQNIKDDASASGASGNIKQPSPSGRGEGEGELLLESARAKLLAARQKRVRPGLDDKILTSWNGLMIAGMASAGRLLGHDDWIDSAERAAQFIHTRLWRDGRLLASWRAQRAELPAYLDDYAFLLHGLLELVQARWRAQWLDWARALADALLTHFEDQTQGGFWFTANDQATPLHRPKTFDDESMPAGNAVAARALLALGHLCAEPRYLNASERALKAALPSAARYPDAHLSTLTALNGALQPPAMVILRGENQTLPEWRSAVNQKFDARRIELAIPNAAAGLSGLLAQCAPRGEICAYVCHGTSCSLPITSLIDLAKALPS